MEEYLTQILRHLPIHFADEEANEFVKYLSEAYVENLEKEKYQFAFTAFHMLNMIFVYKVKWFLNGQGNLDIVNALNNKKKNEKKLSFNNLFDLSQFNEKESLGLLLVALKFHINDISKCINHVDARNQCSHASGKIEYDKKGIDFLIDDEIKYVERLQKKIHPELKKFLEKFLEENWHKTFISGDFKILFDENYFSLEDLELISMIVDLPLFRKKSNNEKNIKQKILYLLLIFEIQNRIEDEKNLFLEKLPIFMMDIPEIVKVKKDDEEGEMYTSEIVEEFLIPIISNFSDEDRINAEKILKLGE